jgi:predicted NodU family carbamoyl transferase
MLPALFAGEVVGWVRGPLEFSIESLGRRLALADPARGDARGRLLGALQRSEPFLTCRVALPAERLDEWVELPRGSRVLAGLAQLQLRARPSLADAAPGAVMPDGSVWAQAVDQGADPEFHDLLLRFGAERGLPALLVTSLRLRGSVLPRSDLESLEILERSGLVAMLVEDRLHTAPHAT